MVRYQPPKDWQQWVAWLSAGLHGRSRWRLSLIIMGIVFARGRRTVTTWLRAVGMPLVAQDDPPDEVANDEPKAGLADENRPCQPAPAHHWLLRPGDRPVPPMAIQLPS